MSFPPRNSPGFPWMAMAITLIVLLLLGGSIHFWLRPKSPSLPAPSSSSLPSTSLQPSSHAAAPVSTQFLAPPPRSPLADRLSLPGTTDADDVRVVLGLVMNYSISLGAVPSGTNREITAALTGKNPAQLAPLPADHPSISSSGELVDRRGHPFFFHNLTRHALEVRARGPDGQLYTSDDVVQASGPAPTSLR